MEDQLPSGATLTGTPGGTDWDCSASDVATNLAECTYTGTPGAGEPAGFTYPAVTVPVVLSSSTAGTDVTDSASASSDDSVAEAQASDVVASEAHTLSQAGTGEGATTPAGSAGSFADQLAVDGATGSVTYSPATSTPAGVSISSTGAVATAGTLKVGMYTASGTDQDAVGDNGPGRTP